MKWIVNVIRAGVCLLALAACESKKATAPAVDPAAAVSHRQTLMKQNAVHWKAIKDFLEEGKGPAADVRTHAEAIQASARRIPGLFPLGTSAIDLPGRTAARPEIWSDWTGFQQAAAELEVHAAKLAMLTEGGDAAAMNAQFAAVARQGCGACHNQFRLKTQ
ncbi:MAG: c-type cytochrome [Dongiaceae bacterium]